MFWRRAAILAHLLVAAAAAQHVEQKVEHDRFTFRLRFSPIGNLAWQLDSMCGLTPADAQVYRRFWRDKFNWTAEDDRMLEQWSKLAAKYRPRALRPSSPSAYPPNGPGFYRGTVLRNSSVRIAALESYDLAAFEKSLARLIPHQDAAAFARTMAHFEPRFQRWWRSRAARSAETLARELRRLMREYDVPDLAVRLAGFTEAQLPPRHDVYFHLMIRPEARRSGVCGTQIRNHLITEFSTADEATPRLSLLVHELTHHLYDSAPAAKHAQLVRAFLAAPEAHSLGLYSYLNEGIAIAAALNLETRMLKPGRFIEVLTDERHVSLDPVSAKIGIGVYPLLEKYTRRGRTLSDGFVPEYLAAASKGLGQLVHSPHLELASRALIVRNPRAVAASREFARSVAGITTLAGRRPLVEYADLSGAAFLLTGELRWLLDTSQLLSADARAAIRQAVVVHSAFVYGVRRSGKAALYLFIADEGSQLLDVQRAFAKSAQPFTGLRFAIERNPPNATVALTK